LNVAEAEVKVVAKIKVDEDVDIVPSNSGAIATSMIDALPNAEGEEEEEEEEEVSTKKAVDIKTPIKHHKQRKIQFKGK
jgi:hypothetical protein